VVGDGGDNANDRDISWYPPVWGRARRRWVARGMFERFTDRARRVVVLAQEEARMLSHNYIGTEHILLGLIRDGEGVAARALESLGISLEAVRQQVEEIIGQGQQAPYGHIPFTPRAKRVLELSLRESRQLGHNYIGTEHILLGLIREGQGVAAQVLVGLGADPNRVRQQVTQLLAGQQGTEPAAGDMGPPGRAGRATHRPSLVPRLHRERPEPPTRQFPDDTGPAGVIPGHARVDLTFERSRLLSGWVGGQPVRLELNVPTHNGVAAGTIAGIPVSASWVNGNNYYVYPDVPSDLTGSFAGQPVELHATFHLEPDYFFDRGTITGHIGTEALGATVEAAAPPGGMGSSRTIAADGTLGSTEFTIYATIDGPLTSGKLRGTVAGVPIRIDAARTRGPDGEQTRLTGTYQGPPALLALTAGALLHFI
jgi:hypothetical protein